MENWPKFAYKVYVHVLHSITANTVCNCTHALLKYSPLPGLVRLVNTIGGWGVVGSYEVVGSNKVVSK